MNYKIIKISFLLVIGLIFTSQANAQLCGQYGVTLNINTTENKPVEHAFVQLLSYGESQIRGKSFVQDNKDLSKHSITFLEGHIIKNSYVLFVSAEGFEPFEKQITFPHCERQAIDIKLTNYSHKNLATVSGTVKIAKYDTTKESKFSQKLIADVYISFKDKNGKSFSTASDKNGKFEIKLPIGKYRVYAVDVSENTFVGLAAEFHKRDFLVKKKGKVKLNMLLDLQGEG